MWLVGVVKVSVGDKRKEKKVFVWIVNNLTFIFIPVTYISFFFFTFSQKGLFVFECIGLFTKTRCSVSVVFLFIQTMHAVHCRTTLYLLLARNACRPVDWRDVRS